MLLDELVAPGYRQPRTASCARIVADFRTRFRQGRYQFR